MIYNTREVIFFETSNPEIYEGLEEYSLFDLQDEIERCLLSSSHVVCKQINYSTIY